MWLRLRAGLRHHLPGTLHRRMPEALKQALRRLGLTRFGEVVLRRLCPWEPAVDRLLRALVQPGWICVDAGAHHEIHALTLAKLVGASGRVVAFEPHPRNARTLRRRLAASALAARVRVEEVAVGDQPESVASLFEVRGGGSMLWNLAGQGPCSISVNATSLDAYFRDDERVDFVKLDIEGAEVRALAGMRRILKRQRPLPIIELHGGFAEGEALLQELSYRCVGMSLTGWSDWKCNPYPIHRFAVPREHDASDVVPSGVRLGGAI